MPESSSPRTQPGWTEPLLITCQAFRHVLEEDLVCPNCDTGRNSVSWEGVEDAFSKFLTMG
jgi:hypothetical protein